jgi:hypothetical protein
MFEVNRTRSNELKGGENAAAKLDDGMGAGGVARLGNGRGVPLCGAA